MDNWKCPPSVTLVSPSNVNIWFNYQIEKMQNIRQLLIFINIYYILYIIYIGKRTLCPRKDKGVFFKISFFVTKSSFSCKKFFVRPPSLAQMSRKKCPRCRQTAWLSHSFVTLQNIGSVTKNEKLVIDTLLAGHFFVREVSSP